MGVQPGAAAEPTAAHVTPRFLMLHTEVGLVPTESIIMNTGTYQEMGNFFEK